jgi:hypothetical protein
VAVAEKSVAELEIWRQSSARRSSSEPASEETVPNVIGKTYSIKKSIGAIRDDRRSSYTATERQAIHDKTETPSYFKQRI